MGGGISRTRWQQVRRLRHARGRGQSGRLLVEGARAVETVLEQPVTPDQILVGPERSPRSEAILRTAEARGLSTAELTRAQAKELAGTVTSQEIFAVVRWHPRTALSGAPDAVLLHLSGIRDPANMGAILRTAAAFGVTVTCSPDCVDTTHPVAVRSGAAAYFDLPVYADLPLAEVRRQAGQHDVFYAATTAGRKVADVAWPDNVILVLGGEAQGATEPVTGALPVTIPIRVESLNVAVAGGILLWAVITGHSKRRNHDAS
jgi:tRNA G18 (ribose-2'-O)-methylase SpoU